MGRTGALALAAMLGMQLAGCSSAAVTSAPPAAPSFANDTTWRQAVQLDSCQRAEVGWVAKGTAANTTGEDVELTVTVTFTTADATVLGREESEVSVPAGGSSPWTVHASKVTGDDVRCVIRAVMPK